MKTKSKIENVPGFLVPLVVTLMVLAFIFHEIRRDKMNQEVQILKMQCFVIGKLDCDTDKFIEKLINLPEDRMIQPYFQELIRLAKETE